jgi:hypothetical protein
LQNAINNETSGLANAHTKIGNLTDAASRAYQEKETIVEGKDPSYSLDGGYIKDYIDTEAGKLSNRIGSVETNYQTVVAADTRFKKTVSSDGVTSYSGDIYDAYTAADSVLNTKIDALAGTGNTSTVAGNATAINELTTGAVATNTNNIATNTRYRLVIKPALPLSPVSSIPNC